MTKWFSLPITLTIFEKLELVDYRTTKTTIQKSFGELDSLKTYFSESEKINTILALYDVFKTKIRQYMGSSDTNARQRIVEIFI